MSAKTQATHFVLSCIDHRVTDDIVRLMPEIITEQDTKGAAKDRYDHVVLPGASIGVTQRVFTSWSAAFFEQLWVALLLHKEIHTVVLIDHLDCGAYRNLYPGATGDRACEHSAHDQSTKELAHEIRARFPKLTIRRLLLDHEDRPDKLDWCAIDLDTGDRIHVSPHT